MKDIKSQRGREKEIARERDKVTESERARERSERRGERGRSEIKITK